MLQRCRHECAPYPPCSARNARLPAGKALPPNAKTPRQMRAGRRPMDSAGPHARAATLALRASSSLLASLLAKKAWRAV